MVFLLTLMTLLSVGHATRVKEVAAVYGVRTNALMGNGLVVGLARTGDSIQNLGSIRTLVTRLQALGVTIDQNDVRPRNVAMVMVTATLPAGTRPGSTLDVLVASAGDAQSIEGGVLLMTPLFAANKEQIAVAQGPVVVGGYSVTSGSRTKVKNHPTTGTVLRGATVEVEIPSALDVLQATSFDWVLNNPDFTTATRMTTVMNEAVGEDLATTVDGGTVRVVVPVDWMGRQPELIALIESLELEVDRGARVGAGVKVHPVSIAHGGLTIDVARRTEVSQAAPLSTGTTEVVEQDDITVKEDSRTLEVLDGSTVGDVVTALNQMGVTPRDLIVILQAMQSAGGLEAEIESK